MRYELRLKDPKSIKATVLRALVRELRAKSVPMWKDRFTGGRYYCASAPAACVTRIQLLPGYVPAERRSGYIPLLANEIGAFETIHFFLVED